LGLQGGSFTRIHPKKWLSGIGAKMTLRILRHFLLGFCTCLLVFSFSKAAEAREGEKTYSISLIKTAEIEEDIYEIDDKRVLAQEYTVQKGDYVWKILRKKALLERRNLSELFSMLKKLNKSLRNLDLIYPGEKIIIPLKITPLTRRQPDVIPSL
jgi:LysM repeat protein